MRSVSIISALALVGSTLAAPLAEPKVVVVTQTAVTTITQGAAAPTQAAVEKVEAKYRPEGEGYRRPEPVTVVKTIQYGQRPQPTTVQAPPKSEAPIPTYAPVPAPAPASSKSQAPPPPPPSSAAPQPSSYPAPAPPSGSGGYIDIVNKYRKAIGAKPLTQDATLESHAQTTCNEGDGNMKHKMIPGTGGQVLAPVAPGADPTDFEKVFVGGWLCENASDPGLGEALCKKFGGGYYYTSTGHYDILKSDKYTKIGCAFYKDIWGCDVGS